MKIKHAFTLLAVGLCSQSALAENATAEVKTSEVAAQSAPLKLSIVKFSGGGWAKADKARAALTSLDSVEKIRVSGATAYVIAKEGSTLTEAIVTKALVSKGLKYVSLEDKEMAQPVALVSAKLAGVGWADTAEKVRVTLEDIDGVAGAFVDGNLELFLSKDIELSQDQLAKTLKPLKIKVSNVTKSNEVAF